MGGGFAYGTISGGRWIMFSSSGTLTGVHVNFLVALREVAGKQT